MRCVLGVDPHTYTNTLQKGPNVAGQGGRHKIRSKRISHARSHHAGYLGASAVHHQVNSEYLNKKTLSGICPWVTYILLYQAMKKEMLQKDENIGGGRKMKRRKKGGEAIRTPCK